VSTSHDPTLGIKLPTVHHVGEQLPVRLNPTTWDKYPRIKGATGGLPSSIKRSDLSESASNTNWMDDSSIERLFVHTMAWGSGTTNGRGPRYTDQALAQGHVGETLRKARALLQDGHPGAAYHLHKKISRVGPAFFTKQLWAIDTQLDSADQCLILDARVWSALGKHNWNSIDAADGSRRWADRYVAYLRACARWADDAEAKPEDVEFTLFGMS